MADATSPAQTPRVMALPPLSTLIPGERGAMPEPRTGVNRQDCDCSDRFLSANPGPKVDDRAEQNCASNQQADHSHHCETAHVVVYRIFNEPVPTTRCPELRELPSISKAVHAVQNQQRTA